MNRNYSEVQLTTQRLKLRPLNYGDQARLLHMFSDTEFMRCWSSAPWTGIEQATAMIDRDLAEMKQGKQIRLGIFLQRDQLLIGTCTLFHLDSQCRRAELGYGIAREYWRQGYMAEAVSALLNFGFDSMQLKRLEADIDPRNVASGRSLEKLGFLQEGFLRERWIVGNEVSDSALFGLLARDWAKRKESCSAGLAVA